MLLERLRTRPGARVLDFCTGSGRNATILRTAGYDVLAVSDADADRAELSSSGDGFAAAISTHGLLHGTLDEIAERIARIAAALEPRGLLYAAFGSVRDARYGSGARIAEATFAPLDGDERGVAHTYFTRERLETLLRPRYVIESLDETGVDALAGAWAHRERPLVKAVHWLAVAHRRAT